jgi:hypothetical protein
VPNGVRQLVSTIDNPWELPPGDRKIGRQELELSDVKTGLGLVVSILNVVNQSPYRTRQSRTRQMTMPSMIRRYDRHYMVCPNKLWNVPYGPKRFELNKLKKSFEPLRRDPGCR